MEALWTENGCRLYRFREAVAAFHLGEKFMSTCSPSYNAGYGRDKWANYTLRACFFESMIAKP